MSQSAAQVRTEPEIPTDSGMPAQMSDDELRERLDRHGIAAGYHNSSGHWIDSPRDTLELAARCFSDDEDPHPLVCTPGRWHPELFGTLILESGHHYRCNGIVDIPGYHILYDDNGQRRFVIAAPEYLKVPDRGWGWQIQLYASRTRNSWGIGDFRDLALICRIAAAQGASAVQVSPVHAIAPTDSPMASPYSPASRIYLNVLHIAPGAITGAEKVDLTDLAERGRALNDERLIDRAAVWAVKREALERIWEAVKDERNIERDRWTRSRGRSLHLFATWSVMVEKFGPDWRNWAPEYQHPANPEVDDFATENAERVAFHSWLQWVASVQYSAACREGVDVIADMAVGSDQSSQDSWMSQDSMQFEFQIGAPPDDNNREGQGWGLAPFNPQQLIRKDFRPFIQIVQATLEMAGAIRVDHVMQLWRLFWVPAAGSPTQGAYVHYPLDALLAIMRLEGVRHDAWIVGEDMGTVAPGVRETMAAIGMLGNRSAMRTTVNEFPYLGVGCSSTHDQMTIAGLITGFDAREMSRIGKAYSKNGVERNRRELCEMAHIDPNKPISQITRADLQSAIVERYRLLRSAPSLMVLVSLDDAAMVKERPNMPGTVDEYPNWCYALPSPVEDIMTSSLADDLALMMGQDR